MVQCKPHVRQVRTGHFDNQCGCSCRTCRHEVQTVTVTAKNGTKPSASIAVSQAGVGVSINDGYNQTGLSLFGKEESLTINGSSNSSKLKMDRFLQLFFGSYRFAYTQHPRVM
ncbi:hypothetical protein NXV85_16790 [Bacteroides fragilis]|nr:hypothetical protein [Bacteroides fragilis]